MTDHAPYLTGQNQWYPFQNRPSAASGLSPVANPAVVPLFDVAKLPESARFVVIGAGVHGMSTAWHLAMSLETSGRSKGSEVVLIDKQGPGAGATGLACGCVRNFYMTGPLHAILRESVAVWESDPVNLGFQQVGYVSVGEANQTSDYEKVHQSQNDSGYPSDLYVGNEAKQFLQSIWPDFKTEHADVVLHERPSGYAGTHMACWGLDQKCRQWGVQRVYGVEVTGFDQHDRVVSKVQTTAGAITVDEAVVVATGAWLPLHADMLGMPRKVDLRYADGHVEKDVDRWTYWRLLEGEIYLPEGTDFRTASGNDSPVLHVELMNTPVNGYDGKEIQDHVYWYTRYAAERVGAPGLQGGTIPIKLGTHEQLEPYGHLNDNYQADNWFAEYYCRVTEMLFGRFEAGLMAHFKHRRNGGIGAFTPDNVPVFDWIAKNAFMTADSNHGFKMIGVGKLVARLLTSGDLPEELAPFAAQRFAEGWTYGDRNSNCPWV